MALLSSPSIIPRFYTLLNRWRLQVRSYAAGTARIVPTFRAPPQKSLQLSLKELSAADMPNDIGIIPGRNTEPQDSKLLPALGLQSEPCSDHLRNFHHADRCRQTIPLSRAPTAMETGSPPFRGSVGKYQRVLNLFPREVIEMSVAYSDPVHRAVTYKFIVRGRPYPKLARRKAVATAIALHKRMYTAFAEYVNT